MGKDSPGTSPQQHQCQRASAHLTACTPQMLSHNVQGLWEGTFI